MAESSSDGLKTLWGKGEIARYEQFLLFPLCFKKRFEVQTRTGQGLIGKALILHPTVTAYDGPEEETF